MGRAVAKIGVLVLAALTTHAQAELFGEWEVDTPPGYDIGEALRASKGLSASDLHVIEYSPSLSVICERDATGPYGPNRTSYKVFKTGISWFALHLPTEFAALETFLRTGLDARATLPRGNTVWVNYGRAWASRNGFSDLIKIGDDNSSPIETVRITGIPKGFGFAAEVLDSGATEAFLRAWNPIGQIPITLQSASGRDLDRKVELRGMKPAVDRVLSYCGRNPL
jgi:hypothetical protein